MATNQIMFGGNILPCTVERFPDIHKAQRKFRQYNIPGRNGDIFFQSDAWENVIQSYQIYAGDGTYGSQAPWTELARCLYLDGYQDLRDTYDPTHFRKAVFNGPIDVENSWNTHGRATIEFNCQPERFLLDGLSPHDFAAVDNSGIALWNLSDFSNYLQSELPGGEARYWVIKIPTGTISRNILNLIPTGGSMTYTSTSSNPATAQSSTDSSSWNYDEIANRTYQNPTVSDSWMILRESYFDEIPVVLMNGDPAFGAGKLVNGYMPTMPKIILHCTSNVTTEILAARINGSGIYINNAYTASNRLPYFILDADGTYYKSDSEDGRRYPADNIRIEGDLTLKSGTNYIYTSANFEMRIIPNWWEL